MKKLLLAAAMAASVASTGAYAVAVDSNITDAGLWLGTSPLVDSATGNGSWANLAIGGDTDLGLTFTGDMSFDVLPASIQVTFDLSDGVRQGVNGAGGTIFQAGTITVLQSANPGDPFLVFSVVDAAAEGGIAFLAGADGHLTPAPQQTTAGLVVDDAGNGTLAGLWSGGFFDLAGGWNNAAASVTLLGNTAGLWLEGSVEASAVPVPAAAWLFGSALIGLAGVGRKRKAA